MSCCGQIKCQCCELGCPPCSGCCICHSTPRFCYVGGCLPMTCCPGTRPPVPRACSGFLALPCYTAPTRNYSVKVDVHKPAPPSPFCLDDPCPCPPAKGCLKQSDCVEGRVSPPRAPLGRSFCEQCKQALWNCCEGPCPALKSS